MAYHHLALAVRDMTLTHAFYTRAMGFELAHVERTTTPEGGSGSHYFYDTGNGELLAFWELDDPAIGTNFPTGLSAAVGLPDWVNHLAFACRDAADLDAIRVRWQSLGLPVLEIDHRWCRSIYAKDPNDNLIEFSTPVAPFDEASRRRAAQALAGEALEPDPSPEITLHEPTTPASPLGYSPAPITTTMDDVRDARTERKLRAS
jgi:catechol 2,3-dioxygenase-like lactoylglutathione lyase family enzyme